MSFLYAASVQGIQKFIFETDKLKEIVGASEMVEHISTKLFNDYIHNSTGKVEVLLSAAGNIKIKAEKKEDLENLVREFPKAVSSFAPGITLSQAIIECSNSDLDEIKKDKEDISRIEKLLKTQRNKQNRPLEISAIGIERSRRTGKSAVSDKKELIDISTKKKIDIFTRKKTDKDKDKSTSLIQKFNKNFTGEEFSNDMGDLTTEKSNWLAVIHADGNGLGGLIQNLKTPIKEFSKKLDKATTEAAKTAFENIIAPKRNEKTKKYPIRPIVIGGDDLTVICSADLALDFTKEYLNAFEEKTKNSNVAGNNKAITASAGIVFVKESYPFHYAINLAEQLCSESKKKSREKASITFHKIQSTFTGSYSEIKERELRAGDINFANGPYFMDELKELQDMVEIVKEKDAPKSGIRKWLTELFKSEESAKQLMDRIIDVTKSKHKKKKYWEKLKLENSIFSKEIKKEIKNEEKLEEELVEIKNTTHLYDILTIASLEGGQ